MVLKSTTSLHISHHFQTLLRYHCWRYHVLVHLLIVATVEFSRNSKPPLQNQCFGLSSAGEFTTVTLTPMFLEPLVFSRFSADEEQERQVEKLIYIRHFTGAYKNIIDIATKYKEQNK